jgi:type IV secretory pathway VirB4 component
MGLWQRKLFLAIAFSGLSVIMAAGCSSASETVFGPPDETEEAGKLVADANKDLTKIKVLYKENEGKREELKNALETNNVGEVKRISSEVVQLINEGRNSGFAAIDKLRDAQDMQINKDYKEYLGLKEESLKKQLEAFEQYRQAAMTLRDNYDPQNAQLRDKVKADFDERTEKYREIMEKARDNSSQANELYKETLRRDRS